MVKQAAFTKFRALIKVMKKGKVLRNLSSKGLHVSKSTYIVAIVSN